MSNLDKRRIVRGVVPVGFPLILYGCFWGLYVGLMGFFGLLSCECGGDVDLAASKGIAGFVSVTVGVFAGTKLTLSAMRAFRLRIAHLEARLIAGEQRVSCLTGPTEPDTPLEEHKGGSSPLKVRLMFYFGALAVGSSVAGGGLLTLIIRAGTIGIYEPGAHLSVSVFVGLAVALFGILGMAAELSFITRAMSRVERRLDRAEITPVVARPRYADAAIQGMQSWIHKLTGVQGMATP